MTMTLQPDESTAPAGESTRPEDPFLHVLGKHQLSSMVATAVDYAVMIAIVSIVRLGGPVTGTVIGASCGALTNFGLNRYFTFKSTGSRARWQLLRYVLVSGGSLLLNAGGMHLLALELRMQYVVARLLIGLFVSLLWNFPMHRYFVFRH